MNAAEILADAVKHALPRNCKFTAYPWSGLSVAPPEFAVRPLLDSNPARKCLIFVQNVSIPGQTAATYIFQDMPAQDLRFFELPTTNLNLVGFGLKQTFLPLIVFPAPTDAVAIFTTTTGPVQTGVVFEGL